MQPFISERVLSENYPILVQLKENSFFSVPTYICSDSYCQSNTDRDEHLKATERKRGISDTFPELFI